MGDAPPIAAGPSRPRRDRGVVLFFARRIAGALQVPPGLLVVASEIGLIPGLTPDAFVREVADFWLVVLFGIRLALRVARGGWGALKPAALVASGGVLLFAVAGLMRLAAVVAALHELLRLVLWVRRGDAGTEVLVSFGTRPARSLVVSFLGLIATGTILLSLPAASRGERVALIDALFTATSATCVTGLTTVDTATTWSTFGLVVILGLIQLGGLGIMAIAAAMTMAVGRTLGARGQETVGNMLDEGDFEEMRRVLGGLVLSTLVIEAIGAVVLFTVFIRDLPPWRAAGHAIFHAVSAFCNAGFAIHSTSLELFVRNPVVNIVIMSLITLGGLGFGVLVGFWRWLPFGNRRNLNVHVKLVVVTSFALTWSGAVVFFFFEYDHTLAHLGLVDKVMAAFFHSVSARTAGFNTVNLELIHPVTLLGLVTLMFIGASPGSTGGGIKTTTFAIILLASRAFMREATDVEVFGRRIPAAQVTRAMALSGGAALTFGLGFAALLVLEDLDFRGLMFETASALGTVGLSLNVTPKLSVAGRLVVIVLMLVGRVGFLTMAAALGSRQQRPAYMTLPEARLHVG